MNIAEMILGLAAGLGFFLFGMKLMSEGLEEVAGTKMKSVLSLCTKNRFIGLIVGMIFTAVIQSSSATTVMVVSFVNSGLMSLVQAVGPIMGANIATTITGQLVSLKLDAVAPIFIIVGVVIVSFMKKHQVKMIGQVLLGFGILFFGMGAMSSAMKPLAGSSVFQNIISQLDNPIFAVLVGLVITVILQSSSASTGIIIAMALSGAIRYDMTMMVIYMILGCNIGTCVSALIACVNGKKDAKRAALIHLFINIIGTIVVGILYLPIQDLVMSLLDKVSGMTPELIKASRMTAEEIAASENPEAMMQTVELAKAAMGRLVANINTFFKIVQIVLLFPFAKPIVKLTQLVVRGDDKKTEGYELTYLNLNVEKTPAAAIMEIDMEIKHMGQRTVKNLHESFETLINPNKKGIDKVLEREQEIDFYSAEITRYMVKLTQQTMPTKLAKNIAGYFHVVNDIERIGDHAENLAEFARTRMDENIQFSDEAIAELRGMYEKVEKTVIYALETFTEQTEEHLAEIVALENEVDILEKELEHMHVRRLAANKCSADAAIFTDVVSNLERISDHATNIAFAIYDEEQYDIEKTI